MYKYLILLATLLSPIVHGSCVHNTSLKPRAVTGEVPISNFGYTGAQGPLNWAALSPENAACSSSTVQSPINIDSKSTSLLSTPPTISIPSVPSAEFENLGTTIEVICNGTTTLNGTDFTLAQFHLHTPSEHRIDEEYFPLEMHMVHESASGGLAVIAVMFQMSSTETTDLLTAVTKNIGDIEKPGTKTETGPLDFTKLIDHVQKSPLLTYTGSLTTPPCAEGLTFIVPQKPLPIDVDTYNKIKKTVRFNSRYTQNQAGEENVLEMGCKAAENARGGQAGGNATVSATASAPVSASVSAPVSAPASVSASASASAVATAPASGEGTGKDTTHCIMGACHTVPTKRVRRWSKF